MEIADVLRSWSEVAGWPLSRIAYEVGVGELTVRRWMSGERIPTGDKLLALQRALPGFSEALLQNEVKDAG